MQRLINYLLRTLNDQGVQILLSLGLLILFVISASVNIPLSLNGEVPYDFPNYYFGGKRFLEGRPIYDFLETEIFNTLGWHNRVYPADPPFAVIILSPLALLSYSQAWITWAVISCLLFLTSIYLVCKELGLRQIAILLTLSVTLSSKPFRFLLFTNHFETLVLLLSVLGWIFLRRKSFRLGLVMWVLAASLKLFPLLWIVGSFRIVGLRKVSEALLLFLGIFLISGYCVGLDNFYYFLFDVFSRSERWYGVIANYSLLSFGYAFESSMFALGLVVCFGLLVAFDLIVKNARSIDSVWCFLIVASLLLSPLCWWGYLILTYPCLLIMLASTDSALSLNKKSLIALSAFLIWIWPEVIKTPSVELTILLSYIPMGILGLLYYISRTAAFEDCPQNIKFNDQAV